MTEANPYTASSAYGLPSNPPKPRWAPALVIVGLCAAGLAVVWSLDEALHGMRNLISLSMLAAAYLALLLWLGVFSRLSPATRFGGVVTAVAVVALFFGAVKIEGFEGDMTPVLAWRFERPGDVEIPLTADRSDAAVPAGADSALPEAAGEFPGYLGADRNATVTGVGLARDWKKNPPKELWRRPVGLGWSSFAVSGRMAVTQEQRGDDEAVVAYDLLTGDQRWAHLDSTRFSETLGGDGPRATPTLVDGRVYSLGASGLLNCLQLEDGKKLWSADILKDAAAENITWGMSGSPLVMDDWVVVNPGGANGQSVAAYHKLTGQRAWAAGDSPAAYSSPAAVELLGQRQILLLNGVGLEGYRTEPAERLWHFPWVVQGSQRIGVGQPVLVPTDQPNTARIFLASGYGVGCALLELTQVDGAWQVKHVWEESPSLKLRAKFSNTVYHKGFIYGLDEQFLVCLDLADGSRRWRGGRYGYGQLMLVDDLLLVQLESGDVALVEATPNDFHELSRVSPLGSKTWNNPTLAGRLLLVRNDREAVCLELPAAAAASSPPAAEEGKPAADKPVDAKPAEPDVPTPEPTSPVESPSPTTDPEALSPPAKEPPATKSDLSAEPPLKQP